MLSAALFQTVIFRLEFSIFTLEKFLGYGYGFDASFLLLYFLLSTSCFNFPLIESFGSDCFSFLQCKKNWVLVSMLLSEGRDKTLSEAVCNDNSRREQNAS